MQPPYDPHFEHPRAPARFAPGLLIAAIMALLGIAWFSLG